LLAFVNNRFYQGCTVHPHDPCSQPGLDWCAVLSHGDALVVDAVGGGCVGNALQKRMISDGVIDELTLHQCKA
jgi:hypothetical protein